MFGSEKESNPKSINGVLAVGSMIPTRFWITKGTGIAEDTLTAYDQALYDAGVGCQNIVTVSSVPPVEQIRVRVQKGSTLIPMPMLGDRIEFRKVPRSTILFAVQALSVGSSDRIATVSIGRYESADGTPAVLAVEDEGTDSIMESQKRATNCLREMMRCRGILGVDSPDFERERVQHASSIVQAGEKTGAALALVVFDPFTMQIPR